MVDSDDKDQDVEIGEEFTPVYAVEESVELEPVKRELIESDYVIMVNLVFL